MDAEKWKKITASFQSRYPEISQIQEGNSALPKQCTGTQCDTNETTNPFEHHPSLENDEVQHLKFLLTEKCQLIEKQGRTISRLEWKLDSLLAKGDGESHETVEEKPSNVRSKENAPKVGFHFPLNRLLIISSINSTSSILLFSAVRSSC
jgi:hypothetical protein